MVKVDENKRKVGIEALFEAVIVRALLDAMFLKRNVKTSYGIKKSSYN